MVCVVLAFVHTHTAIYLLLVRTQSSSAGRYGACWDLLSHQDQQSGETDQGGEERGGGEKERRERERREEERGRV